MFKKTSLIYQESNKILILHKVKYNSEYPIINRFKINTTDRMKAQILTKSKDWEYEEEFRMIFEDGADTNLILPDDAIRRVIIGCNIKENQFAKIKEIIRNRKNRVGLFKAIPSTDEFKLKFEWIKKP